MPVSRIQSALCVAGLSVACLLLTGGGVAFAQESGRFPMAITRQNEIYAGSRLDRVVYEHFTPTRNIALQQYVAGIGQRIAAQTYKSYPFTYSVLEDNRSAYAFASPGGFIYISTGLIAMLESESQLAAVLAHQTAHVVHHHATFQLRYRAPTDLAYVMTPSHNTPAIEASVHRLGKMLLDQSFTLNEELESDILAAMLMARAGYNPHGLVQLLEKYNTLQSMGIYIPYLEGHPPHESRVTMAREFIARQGLIQPGLTLDTEAFHRLVNN